MCIRDSAYTITLTNGGNAEGTVTVTDEVPGQLEITGTNPTATVSAVSYTHLDVYKRQDVYKQNILFIT